MISRLAINKWINIKTRPERSLNLALAARCARLKSNRVGAHKQRTGAGAEHKWSLKRGGSAGAKAARSSARPRHTCALALALSSEHHASRKPTAAPVFAFLQKTLSGYLFRPRHPMTTKPPQKCLRRAHRVDDKRRHASLSLTRLICSNW